ncbi:MAG: hypothetical protein ABI554_03405 [Flavobacterium sp.]
MELEKIIAVLVLYKSSLEESLTFKSLRESIDTLNGNLTILVYNNSPDYWSYEEFNYNNITIISVNDNSNSGVSKAYNVGFDFAKNNNKSYILLLDQDTKISNSFFTAFFKMEKKYSKLNLGLYAPMIMNDRGLVSPAQFFLHTSKKIENIKEGENPLKGLAVINSGLIIATPLFELVGGFNEKIKLDFSDFYFVKKALEFEQNIIVFNAKCNHSLSSEEQVSVKSALIRFDYYLEGAKEYNKSFSDIWGLNAWVFLRSIRLGLKYKTIKFTIKFLFPK